MNQDGAGHDIFAPGCAPVPVFLVTVADRFSLEITFRDCKEMSVPAKEIRAVLRPGVTEEEIQAVAERLLSLAA
jgi:hypothetical protein